MNTPLKTLLILTMLLWTTLSRAAVTQASVDIASLSPIFGRSNAVAVSLKTAINTGCPADADKRLVLEFASGQEAQRQLAAVNKAAKASQPLSVNIDNQCDKTGAARIVGIND